MPRVRRHAGRRGVVARTPGPWRPARF